MAKTDNERGAPISDPLDQVYFELNDEQTIAFAKTLGSPRPPDQALRDLLKKDPPWETGKDRRR